MKYLLLLVVVLQVSLIWAQKQYTPYTVNCPSGSLVRKVSSVSDSSAVGADEQAWLDKRAPNVKNAWQDYLGRVNVAGFDQNNFLSGNLPRVALAASGGGYRAMLNTAGVISAFDARDSDAQSKKTGGILQLSTYFSGLSGGAWFLSSFYDYDLRPVDSLKSKWNLDDDLYTPSSGIDTLELYSEWEDDVSNKEDAGFDTSLVDYWARAISYHLYEDKGDKMTWSAVVSSSQLAQAQAPFPIQVVNQVFDEKENSDGNVWEWNPYESGSYQKEILALVKTQYLGTRFSAGKVSNKCYNGFDNIGWITGTSSAAFVNAFNCAQQLIGLNRNGIIDTITDFFDFDCDDDDAIRFSGGGPMPNPFKGLSGVESQTSKPSKIYFGDGGLDNQNIPLFPLLIPARKVNVIVAIDTSADTEDNWPTGQSLAYSSKFASSNNVPFPPVPSSSELKKNSAYRKKMTIFGCYTSSAPTIVYLPNHEESYESNLSTFKTEYSDKEANGVIQNGFDQWTVGDYPTCLACALISGGKSSNSLPSACTTCFNKYCYGAPSSSSSSSSSSSASASPAPSSPSSRKPPSRKPSSRRTRSR